ncbi:glycosyltransferase family 4 protein [Desulfobotulus sp. H1]|uniref:Glycosyltransferase family 4 protein n=1 Tax=Desulfobotulus pelophilus TaxID=2823377 RepID=A0ABT3NE72_9BACT|nr:glycosyltransferase family 4 protein [Desulfobotulus pelophilus]MCW7755207.1 glycosyltransferase family 4 protein [Desulfobotulus pelophilus]
MRIAQVLTSSGFGGAERLFVDICNGMARRGHDVLALCPENFQGLSLMDTNPLLRTEFLRSHWDRNLFAEQRIRKEINVFRPDVVHTHLARSASLTGAALRERGVPIIANMHNYVKLKYYKNIDYFVPGTEHQAAYLHANGIAKERISVIPHFTNICSDGNEAHDFSSPVLVAFGRFVHKKGFDVLLRAIVLLQDQGINPVLFLGGDGPEADSLKKLAYELGISERIHFCGWVEDVDQFLRKAPFFVLPSRDEPFGIVVLEAMASGNCIIATRTRGPVEVLRDDSAFFCKIDDCEDMAEAIARAMRSPEVAKEHAVVSRGIFAKKFAPDVILSQYERFFSEILSFRNPMKQKKS